MRRLVLIILALLAVAGCRPVDAPWPPTAALCWGNALRADEAVLGVRHFEYQMTSVRMADLDAAAERGMTMSLYVSSDSVAEWMADSRRGTFAAEWWRLGQMFPARSVDGGLWSPWPGKHLVDVTSPAARRAMVQAVQGHLPPSKADVGLMFDFFTIPRPAYLVGEQPALDLDGDGVSHEDDPGEQPTSSQRASATRDTTSPMLSQPSRSSIVCRRIMTCAPASPTPTTAGISGWL